MAECTEGACIPTAAVVGAGRGTLWPRLHQAKPLGSAVRRPRRRRLSLLLCLASQVGILLNDSTVDQLTEGVKLDHSQAILKLATKPLPETRLFLLISIHVITGVL